MKDNQKSTNKRHATKIKNAYAEIIKISGVRTEKPVPKLNLIFDFDKRPGVIEGDVDSFGSYLSKLNEIKVYVPEFTWNRSGELNLEKLVDTLAHEYEHYIQSCTYGDDNFFGRYNFESALNGYTNNKYEIEANEAGARIAPLVMSKLNYNK